ncbi:hypothetical protein [Alkaliphilus transvaalensis]|uniref:hypothetical protein n=1 Tax=Alkaliphilus transvaalensis TaxID=114628 RepID=UPI00047BDDBF|nr:hypothetical protein [Alkaliphilus transvaalensis]
MKPLVAQSGLQYHVNLSFSISLTNNQLQQFKKLFENIVACAIRINDEGITLRFEINVNDDIGSYGGFKDVPGKTEVNKFMPILLTSDTFLKSDIVFLSNLVKDFINKEKFHKRKMPIDVIMLDKKITKALETPEITITNLVHDKK